MHVRIVDFAQVRVAALEHHGPPAQLDQTVEQFIQWRMASRQSPVGESRTFGIPYGNPDTTTAQAFRFDICGEINGDVAPNDYGTRKGRWRSGRRIFMCR